MRRRSSPACWAGSPSRARATRCSRNERRRSAAGGVRRRRCGCCRG
jgi:hypothetical protein